jgi:BirA family transcriptional regulator, biotin operon repressor / biotin---[acetyl-CoA-carboxylase] ligase
MIIGSKQIFIKKLTSTNTYANQLLVREDLPEGTVVRADFQSAGKGQAGNKWESENGMNLLFSIILYPSFVLPSEQFLVSMAISLGICDFLKSYSDNCTIKWPNDIYVSNDKIAGILIEHSIIGDIIKTTIAGIGLNINQVNFISDAPNPVSLRIITGKEHDLGSSLSTLLSDLDIRYKQLIKGDFSRLRNEYILQLYRLNEWFDYKDLNGPFKGRIVSVTEEGRLQIEKIKGGISEYSFKEVDFTY